MKMISKESAHPPHPVLLCQNALGHVNADTSRTRWWLAWGPPSCREPLKLCSLTRMHTGVPTGLSQARTSVCYPACGKTAEVSPFASSLPCTSFQIPEPLGDSVAEFEIHSPDHAAWEEKEKSSQRRCGSETAESWHLRPDFSFMEAAVTSHRGRKMSYSKTSLLRYGRVTAFSQLAFARRNPEKRGEFPGCALFLCPKNKDMPGLSGLSFRMYL